MTEFSPTPLRDDNTFKPQDWKNIFLFMLISVALAWAFDHYIMAPKQAAMKAQQEQMKAVEAALPPEALQPPRPREQVVADTARISFGNSQVALNIPLRGSRLDDLTLKNYFTELDRKKNITLFSPAGTDYPEYAETGWVSIDPLQAMPGPDAMWQQTEQGDGLVILTWENGTGLRFTRQIALDRNFMLTITQTVKNTGTAPVTLANYALLSQHGLPEHRSGGIVHDGAVGYVGQDYVGYGYSSWDDLATEPKTWQARAGWLGITSHYFFAGLIPDQKENITYRLLFKPKTHEKDKDRYQADLQGESHTVAPGRETSFTVRVFAGAKELRLLEKYENDLGIPHFDLAVDFGWFYFLTRPFYFLLVTINDYTGNFGVSIILLTLLIRLAVFPLANTSFKSFAKMKKVTPQVQELQKLYAHDKKKLQEELMGLYAREKVNPLSGCLPILAQIPIFFAIYKVLSVAIEPRHAPFFGWIKDLSAPDPTSMFNLYGLLDYDVPSFLNFGIWPTFMMVMILIQTRLNPPPTDPMMKIFFNYYYPVVICFMMAHFSAGLVIYWAFSAFLSVAQQMFIMRTQGVPIHLFEMWKKPTLKTEPEAESLPPSVPTALPDDLKVRKKKK